MTASSKQSPDPVASPPLRDGYQDFLSEVSTLLAAARKQAARAVNTVLVATYWELGRKIVEFEQGHRERADYGTQLIERLTRDLTKKFGKIFSRQNLQYWRQLYNAYPPGQIRQTVSDDFPSSRKNPGQCLGFLAVMRSRSVFPVSCVPDAIRLTQEIESPRQLLDKLAQSKTGGAQ